MLKWITFCLAVVVILSPNVLLAQDEKDYYQYSVNLSETINDMITVDLIVPIESNQENEIIFHMPATIPGTYEINDFGQFVQDLKAFDKKNKPLKVERKDINTWRIVGEKKLYRINYKVEDTWDAKIKNPIFEPSGTNFDQGNVFVINHNACFGFIKGKENLPFEVTFKRPAKFYGSTALDKIGGDFDTDIYRAANYREFVDAPIMYCVPDTVQFRLGMSDILISVYSPNEQVTAKQLLQYIKPTVEAQFKYLDEVLPVKKYSFIIFLSKDSYPSNSAGALEHARSSFFCMIEETAEKIGKQIAEIAAHEFFHIITPLHIHSEQIHNFDFMAPKMSKHLWFYEGVIEYMAHHVRAKYEISTRQEFLKNLSKKVRSAAYYNATMPMTEMSENCLVTPYSKQYNNVYYKGALLGMCLDLKIIELSQGKKNLQDLIRALALEYGSHRAFEDAKFFDIILNMLKKELKIANTEPINEFFKKYVSGGEKLPYNEYLNPFGIRYDEVAKIADISPLGGLENGALKSDSLDRFYISGYQKLDKFGTEHIGFQKDDIIVEWNGRPFNVKTVSSILLTYLEAAKEGDSIVVKVLRKNSEGVEEEVMLSTVLKPIEIEEKHVFQFTPEATDNKLLNAWLKG